MTTWKNAITPLVAVTLSILVAGCGGGTSGSGSVSKLQESDSCIGCHGKVVSPGTGVAIADEWKLSGHNTKDGASCTDCHEPKAGHPNSCNTCHNGPNVPIQDEVVRNPDSAGICDKCHARGKAHELPVNHYYRAINDTRTAFDKISSVAWVTTASQRNCNWCHNPHNTVITQQHKDWAESGHGDIYGAGWIYYNFKTRGTTGATTANSVASDCVRCHTTTGYINYVTSNFRNISSWGSTKDPGKQTLYCNACHVDASGRSYGYKVRTVPQVTGFYNYSVKGGNALINAARKRLLVSYVYPSVGNSNICLACHVGRENGDTLKAIEDQVKNKLTYAGYSSFYRNLSFVNSHYLTGGATVFGASGYEYTGRNYANDAHYMHDMIGRNNTSGTGTSGPCVGCHIRSGSHTFKPFTYDSTGKVATVANPICAKCHDSANPMTPEIVEAETAAFNAAMAALKAVMAQKGIYYRTSNPYFFTAATGGTGYTRWRKVETLGAAFNYNVLAHDPGAYAHNRLYAKRLIYDSIEWMYAASSRPFGDNGTFGAVGNVEAAINATTLSATDKSAAIKYLQGTAANPTGVGGGRL